MDIAHFREKLEAEKQKLEAALSSVAEKTGTPGDWSAKTDGSPEEPDPVDAADKQEGYEADAAVTDDLELRYAEIIAALARVENGSYGKCEISGEEIEEARLEANPAARTCLTHLNQASQ